MMRIRPTLVAVTMLGTLIAGGCDSEDSSSEPAAAADSGGGKQDGVGDDGESAGISLRFDMPALYEVSGVSSDDVLNVRAQPTSSSDIVGELAPDATDVEVVAIDATGRWAMVNVNETAGWASLSFLEALDSAWEGNETPEHLNCLGTEPFWGLSVDGDTVRLSSPIGDDQLSIEEVLVPAGFASGTPMRTILASSEIQDGTVSITPGLCSDGASDMLYGLHVNVVLREEGINTSLGGCCSIAP
ncbi:MAG: SH3 domain-containing protein [Myxococcota bacterium]